MIEKNEQTGENTMDLANVKLIADKKKILEETASQVQREIRSCFEQLVGALKSREKQLLRQVEAVRTQQLSLVQSDSELITTEPAFAIDLSAKHSLEENILNLGRLEVLGTNSITINNAEPYKVQEYQDANEDHESFNKSIEHENKDRLLVEQTKMFEAANKLSVSMSDDSTVMCNDSTLSSSYNSSLNSSSDNEARPNQGNSIFTYENCTAIDEPSESLNSSNYQADSLIPVTLGDRTVSNTYKTDIKDSDKLLQDSMVLKLKVDYTVHYDGKKEELSIEVTDTKDSSSYEEEGEKVETDFDKDINSNKEHDSSNATLAKNQNVRRDSSEHPKQVQQWLQQILVETETEPMIHEIGQFSEISKARLSGQFPMET